MKVEPNRSPRPAPGPLPAPLLMAVWSTAQRLANIEKMGQRIQAHVAFMHQIESLAGTSGESRARAVAAFYECLVVSDDQLGRIQKALKGK